MRVVKLIKEIISKQSASFVFLLFAFFNGCILFAQDNSQQLKRLQRAIFIFNSAEQVIWPSSADQNKVFTIGVLGLDRTVIDLKALSVKRKIHQNQVVVTTFSKIKDIDNIQLLYVNKSFNYDIDNIISKISGRHILLITEDYDFNTSMINMVNVGSSFEYEINAGLILNTGLKYVPSLKSNAVSSSQKWKELYQATESSLKKEKQKSDEQRVVINAEQQTVKNQKVKIDTFVQEITKQKKWIKELGNINALQQKKVEEKIVIEAALEKSILEKIAAIDKQNEMISYAKKEINVQSNRLIDLGLEINEKDNYLKQKTHEVNSYRKINLLLFAVASLIFVIGLLVYKNYRSTSKLSKVLAVQNKSILKQSKILEFKNKELEQFAYITSHDLKEPLVTISGMIDMLIEDYGHKLDDSGKMSLDFIKESSVRMKDLIDSLLEYSRLGRTKEATQIDTNTLIASLKNDLRNVIDRTNATIIVKNMCVIKGTEFEIRLLFQNLISNAMKFISPGIKPLIVINCEKIVEPANQNQGFYQFSIKDNGIGIEKRHQDRIFSIFQRLHSREEYEGTGIGLAHCKKIIEAHEGSIWLESEVGKGTTFFFTIPFSI
jgi:two-component system, chemotaxis family, sensor kinase Cph1